MEDNFRSFMAWTAGYDSGASEGTNNLPCHEDYIKSLHCPILRIEGPMATSEQVERILNSPPLL